MQTTPVGPLVQERRDFWTRLGMGSKSSSLAKEADDKKEKLLDNMNKFVTKEDKEQGNKILKEQGKQFGAEAKEQVKKMWGSWENTSQGVVDVFTKGTDYATNTMYLGLPLMMRPLARCIKRNPCLTVLVLLILDIIDMIPTLTVELPGVDGVTAGAEDTIYAPTYGAFSKELIGTCPGVAVVGSLKTLAIGLDLLPTSTTGWALDKCGYTTFVNSCCMVGICFILTWLIVTGVIAYHEDDGFLLDCVCGAIDGAPAAWCMSFGVAFLVTMAILPQFLKGKCKYITVVVLALMTFSSLDQGVGDMAKLMSTSPIKHTWWIKWMCEP